MSKSISGESAYPTGHDGDPGLTKREYFAGMAMQGLLASFPEHRKEESASKTHPQLAMASVMLADALIAELSKEQKP